MWIFFKKIAVLATKINLKSVPRVPKIIFRYNTITENNIDSTRNNIFSCLY